MVTVTDACRRRKRIWMRSWLGGGIDVVNGTYCKSSNIHSLTLLGLLFLNSYCEIPTLKRSKYQPKYTVFLDATISKKLICVVIATLAQWLFSVRCGLTSHFCSHTECQTIHESKKYQLDLPGAFGCKGTRNTMCTLFRKCHIMQATLERVCVCMVSCVHTTECVWADVRLRCVGLHGFLSN